MIAEIISVGTELLLGQIVDTDAAYVAQALAPLGISIYHRSTVGDNTARLRDTLSLALSRADIIITIGGLGPTMDDLTKEAVAEVMGVAMVEDAAHAAWLREFASSRAIAVPPSFYKQALVPFDGQGLANPSGTALGALFQAHAKVAICLPGPPGELIPMMDEQVAPALARITGNDGLVIRSRVLRIIGIGESAVEERVRDLMAADNPTVAPYAKTGEVHLRITARAHDTGALIEPVAERIRERLGDAVYGVDDQTLESVVVDLLRARGQTVSVAESCSGGLIAKRITDVPGASDVFGLGIVTYSDDSKRKLLRVPSDALARYGAVSSQVARAMAQGVREAAGADIGVSVTGIAGPTGGSAEKPVGTVHIGISWGDHAASEHYHFLGRRSDIAQRASQSALALIRRLIVRPDDPLFATGS